VVSDPVAGAAAQAARMGFRPAQTAVIPAP